MVSTTHWLCNVTHPYRSESTNINITWCLHVNRYIDCIFDTACFFSFFKDKTIIISNWLRPWMHNSMCICIGCMTMWRNQRRLTGKYLKSPFDFYKNIHSFNSIFNWISMKNIMKLTVFDVFSSISVMTFFASAFVSYCNKMSEFSNRLDFVFSYFSVWHSVDKPIRLRLRCFQRNFPILPTIGNT